MAYVLPPVSMIVIGFNEARNLRRTFEAIRQMNYSSPVELIYVDSGSSDNSVKIAAGYCDKVFVEPDWPTAARNRNRGLIECSYDFCHFLDGDIIIDPDYLSAAIQKILEGNVQVVFGYLEEKSQQGLNRILLHDYRNRKPGYINAPGAGGTYKKDVLIEVNGWDERIPRGEEMEIGDRLLAAGYKIWYLNHIMGIHDFGITNVWKLCKKQIREGMSIGQVTRIESSGRLISLIRKLAARNIVFHLMLMLFIIATLITGLWWLIPLSFLMYIIYLFVKYRVIRGIRNPDTLLYHYLKNLTKFFELYGYYKFLIRFNRLSKEQRAAFQRKINIRATIDKGEPVYN